MDEIDYNIEEGNRLKTKEDNVKNGNHKIIYDYFINKGLTPAQTSGIIGNLATESYYDIRPHTENNIGAYGIAQWLGSRKKELFKFAKTKNKEVSSLGTQLDFLWYEFNSTEKRAFKALKSASTPIEASEAFLNKFERPSDKEKEDTVDLRNKYANQFYSTLYGEDFKYNTEDSKDSFNYIGSQNLIKKDQIDNQSLKLKRLMRDMNKMVKDNKDLKDFIKNDESKSKINSKLSKRELLKNMISSLDAEFVSSK